MKMSMKHEWNDHDKGKLKSSEKNLSRYLIHHKSHLAVFKRQFVPSSIHSKSRFFKNQSVSAVYGFSLSSEIHVKDINSVFGNKLEFLNVKFDGM